MNYRFINTEYLETVTGGDKEILSEIVAIFRSQIVEIHDQMKLSHANNDSHSLGMLAHKAKSSVAIMGMNDLAEVLRTFEIDAKEGKNSEKYTGYIERYEIETKQAVLELDNYINNL
jgi:HPt (histidine-containing phosphotransfer) domain-containing protein